MTLMGKHYYLSPAVAVTAVARAERAELAGGGRAGRAAGHWRSDDYFYWRFCTSAASHKRGTKIRNNYLHNGLIFASTN